MERKTIKSTALDLYNKGYDVKFISSFLGIDILEIKLMVLKDDPNKQFSRATDVPNKKKEKVKNSLVPAIRQQIAEDMPSIIKGLTLVGYDLKGIAEEIGIPEDVLLEAIDSIDDLAMAYKEAKFKINMKVAETLLATILPRQTREVTYKYVPIKDAEGKIINYEKIIDKEVIKDISGSVEGMFKWLEKNAPEKWSEKSKNIADFLKESGIALMPTELEEAQWENVATDHQDTLVDMMEEEKKKVLAFDE